MGSDGRSVGGPDLTLRTQLHIAWDGFLNLFFPPHCVGCSRAGAWLCTSCLTKIEYVQPPLCPACGRALRRESLCPSCRSEPLPIDGIRAAAYFEGPLRKAIHAFKYKGLRVLAAQLGQILTTCWSDHPLPADVIVPVPLHPSRARRRGYNQSALLARELARRTGHPMVEDCLCRTKDTRPQVGLNTGERRDNVVGAFRCVDDRLSGLKVLLIDDVCTTGATLAACAIALRHAGAMEVWALTLARERRNRVGEGGDAAGSTSSDEMNDNVAPEGGVSLPPP